MGLDLSKGIIRNNLEYGVIEPAMSKVKIIQVGTHTHKHTWPVRFLVTCLVWDPSPSYISFSPQFATEAAITIVRIDDMIKLDKEESGQEE